MLQQYSHTTAIRALFTEYIALHAITIASLTSSTAELKITKAFTYNNRKRSMNRKNLEKMIFVAHYNNDGWVAMLKTILLCMLIASQYMASLNYNW